MKNLTIIAQISLLLLASCTKEQPVGTSVIAIGYDNTKSVVHDVQCSCEGLNDAVLRLFSLENEHRYDGVTVMLFEISNVSQSNIVKVELPAVRERFMRIQKDRDEEIAVFNEQLKQAICDLRHKQPVDGNTYFNRNVCSVLNRINRTPVTYKAMIICSDGVESNLWDLKAVLNQENFKLSKDHKETLSNDLFDDCTLRDLGGMPIYLLHKAIPETDALIVAAHDLMEYHYSKFNAHVESISDIDFIEIKHNSTPNNNTNGGAE